MKPSAPEANRQTGSPFGKIGAFFSAHPRFPVVLTFLIVYGFFALVIDFRALFSNTIMTGADNASWYQSLKHLTETLLPNGRLFGWSQANFFGYNEFQYYFIPPFLFAAFLGLFMPLTIALKLATLAGILTLPLAVYHTAKILLKDKILSLSAVLLSLLFVLNSSYSMFGGNFYSILIGEFCYSFALTLFALFIGKLCQVMNGSKKPWVAGILLGLTGLSHLFVFLYAATLPAFFLLARKIRSGGKPVFGRSHVLRDVLLVYLTAFLVMAFWIVPLVFTRRYAQSVYFPWSFAGIFDFFKQTSAWVIVIASVLSFFLVLKSGERRLNGWFYLFQFGAAVFWYFAANALETIGVRFWPPALLVSIFAVCDFFYWLDGKRKGGGATSVFFLSSVLAAVVLSLIMLGSDGKYFSRNYGGYEATPDYPLLMQIASNYGGTIDGGRLLTEEFSFSNNTDFGSAHVFDNIYLFTGRPGSEGIHYGSSFTARMNAYLYSEFSVAPVPMDIAPIYSRVDRESWPYRFYQLNAKDIVTVEQPIVHLFLMSPEFTNTGTFGKYRVFTFRHFPHSYVQVADWKDVCTVDDRRTGFKPLFLRQFRDYPLMNFFFVPLSYAQGLEGRVAAYTNYDAYRLACTPRIEPFDAWVTNYPYGAAVSNESVGHLRMEFTTAQLGLPHIVKVTYSPNFRSLGGEKIYPVSPGFMMIVPEKNPVVIVYGRNAFEIAGMLLTLLLVPLFLFRRRLENLELPAQDKLETVAVALFAGFVLTLSALSLGGHRMQAWTYERALRLYRSARYDQALRLVDKYARIELLDRTETSDIYEFMKMKIDILRALGQKEEADRLYRYLRWRYPYRRG